MRVDVDGPDPLAAHRHRQLLPRSLLPVGALQEAATAKHDPGSGSGAAAQKVTACGHDGLPPWLVFRLIFFWRGVPAPRQIVAERKACLRERPVRHGNMSTASQAGLSPTDLLGSWKLGYVWRRMGTQYETS